MTFYQKNPIYGRLTIFLCICLVFLFTTGCRVPETADFSYTEVPFSLTLTGSITLSQAQDISLGKIRGEIPVSFSATVSSDVIRPSGENGAYENAVTVTYTAPESLKGLKLTCRYKKEMAGDEPVTLTYPAKPHAMIHTARYEDVRYLLLPVTLLFPQGDVTSVSPTHDKETTVTLQSKAQPDLLVTYIFSDEQPHPKSIVYASPERKIQLDIFAAAKDSSIKDSH